MRGGESGGRSGKYARSQQQQDAHTLSAAAKDVLTAHRRAAEQLNIARQAVRTHLLQRHANLKAVLSSLAPTQAARYRVAKQRRPTHTQQGARTRHALRVVSVCVCCGGERAPSCAEQVHNLGGEQPIDDAGGPPAQLPREPCLERHTHGCAWAPHPEGQGPGLNSPARALALCLPSVCPWVRRCFSRSSTIRHECVLRGISFSVCVSWK